MNRPPRRCATAPLVALLVFTTSLAYGQSTPPANDECEGATGIVIDPITRIGTGVTIATYATSNLSDRPFGGLQTVWYKWTALATERTRVQTCNSSSPADDSLLVVFAVGDPTNDVTSCNSLIPIAYNDDFVGCSASNKNSRLCIHSVAGRTYYAMVASKEAETDPSTEYRVELRPTTASFCPATSGACCVADPAACYNPTSEVSCTSVGGLWQGPNTISCQDCPCNGDLIVGEHAGAYGTPANDNCDGATLIEIDPVTRIGASFTDAVYATANPNDHGFGCYVGDPGAQGLQTVWYKWTALATERTRVQTCNSSSPADDSLLVVFAVGDPTNDVTSCNSLIPITCGDDFAGCSASNKNSRACISAIAGQTYYAMVASKEAETNPGTEYRIEVRPTTSSFCPTAGTAGACCVNGTTCYTWVNESSCTSWNGVWEGLNTTSCQNCCSEAAGQTVRQPGPQGVDLWITSSDSYEDDQGVDNGELRVGGSGDCYHSLIRFDLAGLPDSAHAAAIMLYHGAAQGTPVAMHLDRVDSFWDEGTGWHNAPATTPLTTIPAPAHGSWYSMDITALFNAWRGGAYTNWGIRLRPVIFSSNDLNIFYSSDHMVEPALRPRLVVSSCRQVAPSHDQPGSGRDTDRDRVSLDHLWEWSPEDGRFVDPGPGGVTINPNLPTYLLTHGWDGSLDGRTCGTLTDVNNDETIDCADATSSDDKPEFAMSSVAAAIYRATQESEGSIGANLVAWEWADAANNDDGCLYRPAWEQLRTELARCADSGPLNRQCAIVASARAADSFLGDAQAAAGHIQDQGSALAEAIRKYVTTHGSFGTQLHMIGKSHGGGVVGVAAQALRGHYPVATLTTLDTPNVPGVVNTLQFVSPNVVTDHVAVFYYPLNFGGFGTAIGSASPKLTNVRLNGIYAHGLLAHLWIAGDDDCRCQPDGPGWLSGECEEGDGWFPPNAWNEGSGSPSYLTFIPPSPSPPYSLLNVSDFPSGNWEERDPYTFVPLERGACCYNVGIFGDCTELTQVDCQSYPGQYMGNGTLCVDADSDGHPDICETSPPPNGACCYAMSPSGPFSCDERSEAFCAGLGFYSWHGAGTRCDQNGDGFQDICDATAASVVENVAFPTLDPAPGLSLIRYDSFQSAASWFGNLTQLVVGGDPDDATNRVILMQEQGDASFFKDISWPTDALLVTFDYLLREPRGEESLTVYVDNHIVYYDNAETTLAREHLTSSGAIYVGNVAGQTARLNFVLRTDEPEGGEFGGELAIDNIRVYGFLEHDLDLDGDRDLSDFAAFQRCFGATPMADECWGFDVDGLEGVGMSDYGGDTAKQPTFEGLFDVFGNPTVPLTP